MFEGSKVDTRFDIAIIKEDIKKLTFIILREMFNDFAMFNRFPELKISEQGVQIHGSLYNRQYYQDLFHEANSDFIKGLCLIYSIKHPEFLAECQKLKIAVDIGPVKFQAKYWRKRLKTGRTEKGIIEKLKKLRTGSMI
jgi:hypothetical protein